MNKVFVSVLIVFGIAGIVVGIYFLVKHFQKKKGGDTPGGGGHPHPKPGAKYHWALAPTWTPAVPPTEHYGAAPDVPPQCADPNNCGNPYVREYLCYDEDNKQVDDSWCSTAKPAAETSSCPACTLCTKQYWVMTDANGKIAPGGWYYKIQTAAEAAADNGKYQAACTTAWPTSTCGRGVWFWKSAATGWPKAGAPPDAVMCLTQAGPNTAEMRWFPGFLIGMASFATNKFPILWYSTNAPGETQYWMPTNNPPK